MVTKTINSPHTRTHRPVKSQREVPNVDLCRERGEVGVPLCLICGFLVLGGQGASRSGHEYPGLLGGFGRRRLQIGKAEALRGTGAKK